MEPDSLNMKVQLMLPKLWQVQMENILMIDKYGANSLDNRRAEAMPNKVVLQVNLTLSSVAMLVSTLKSKL